jgi:hypothetical protein
MNIFDTEIKDGLEQKIRAEASISIACLAEPSKHTDKPIKVPNHVVGSEDDFDLYYLECILASASDNKNDDVFLPEELWAARATPVDKPTNLEHDPNLIVGHITATRGIDDKGNPIPEDAKPSDLPSFYHLACNSVIYRELQTDELKSRANKLIEEIEAGSKYVSMECLFSGFDYLAVAADGSKNLIKRSSSSAYLTKHLRRYGGTGSYGGYKIKRVLRNITFSGKGFVDKPANENSIIFSKAMLTESKDLGVITENTNVFEKDGVSIGCNLNIGDKDTMAEDNKLEKELNETKALLKEAQEALAKASAQKFEEKITQLTEQVTASTKKEVEYKENLDKVVAELADANKKIEEANQAKATVEKELNQIKAESLKASRVHQLTDAGVDKAKAEETVEKFAFLNDEQFKSVAELAVIAAKKDEKKDDKKKEDKKEDTYASDEDGEKNADEKVLEDAAKASDKDPSLTGSESDPKEAARAALSERLAGLMTRKKAVASK